MAAQEMQAPTLTHDQAAEQLHDITEIDARWWQALLDWLLHYGVGILAILITLAASYWLWRWWQARALQRWQHHTLCHLEQIMQDPKRSTKQKLAALSLYAKRIAIKLHGRKTIAGLHGEQWLAWLDHYAPAQAKIPGFRWREEGSIMLTQCYAPDISTSSNDAVQHIYIALQQWLKHARSAPSQHSDGIAQTLWQKVWRKK